MRHPRRGTTALLFALTAFLTACSNNAAPTTPTPSTVPNALPSASTSATTEPPSTLTTAPPSDIKQNTPPNKIPDPASYRLTTFKTYPVSTTLTLEVPAAWPTVALAGTQVGFLATTGTDTAPQTVAYATLGKTADIRQITPSFLEEAATSLSSANAGAATAITLYSPDWGRIDISLNDGRKLTAWLITGIADDVLLVTTQPATEPVVTRHTMAPTKGTTVKQVESLLNQLVSE